MGGEPDSAVALVARALRAAAAATAAVIAIIAAHKQLHNVIPDCTIRITRACIAKKVLTLLQLLL